MTPPPPPGLPSVPLADNTSLHVGDVIQVSTQLRDKTTGQPYWWKRFMVVTKVPRRHVGWVRALLLKLHPDLDRDFMEIGFSTDTHNRLQVVTKVPEDKWPQGVIAMRMKAVTLGWVKLGDNLD